MVFRLENEELNPLEEFESLRPEVSRDTYERHWAIPKIIPPNPKVRILDIGAGKGYLSSKLKAQGHDVVAIEIAAVNVEHLKQRNIEVLQHDLMSRPYPIEDESFDIVICADVLEHLLRPDICLKEVYRILKSDGNLIVCTPNESHPYRIWQLIKGDSFHDPFNDSFDAYQFWTHVKFFTYRTLKRFLEHFGFFVRQVFLPMPRAHEYAKFTKGSKLKELLAIHIYPKIFYRVSPRFCDEPILVCQKKRSGIQIRILYP